MGANEGKLFPLGVFIVCSCLSWSAQICAGSSAGAETIGARALSSFELPSLVRKREEISLSEPEDAKDSQSERLGKVGRNNEARRMGKLE